MADAAAARREARRRKILENSHNRLQRISGKCEGEIPKESSLQTLIPDKIYEAPTLSALSSDISIARNNSFNNGVVVSEVQSVVSTSSPSFEADASGDGLAEIANDFAAFMSPTSQPVDSEQVSHWEKLILYKYDVVIVSLLVQILYSLVFTMNETLFFLPLIVYDVTKMIWFPAPSSSNFANALLLLNGISVQKVERIMSIMRWVSMFSHDVCVYLFTTICIQALYTTVKDCLVT